MTLKMTISNFLLMAALAVSCGRNVEPEPQPQPVPDPPAPVEETLAIISFSLPEYPDATISIKDASNSIDITLPYPSVAGEAVIEFALTEGASSNPASGSKVDLSSPFSIFLSLPSGKARKYTVTTTTAPCNIVSFKWIMNKDCLVKGVRNGNAISFTLPYGTDLTNLTFDAPADYVLSFEPDITAGVDLSSPLDVLVYAEDGMTTKKFTLSAECFPENSGVRGVYLPSPAHTRSFATYDNVCKSLDLMRELNFNCLFVCSWAGTKTAWPSEVLLANTTYSSASQGNMYASYSGGSGDAIADIIAEAHKRDIKVVLWFEYGFMHNVGGTDWDDPLLACHPEWMGIGSDGKPCNYNSNDFYLNGYDPAVQKFMIDTMSEAVMRYPELDGVQGDDRLPAMPRNSGYDEVTSAAWRAAKGSNPPSDYNNRTWVDWRLDILNGFAVDMHHALKAINPSLLVCFAPNKYPWCESNLMQDWPQWLADGVVDLLTVQCYVTNNYNNDVDSTMGYVKKSCDRNVFNPAMILKNGGAILPATLISEELQKNRQVGTCGESQFWFDGLLEPDVQSIFRAWYRTWVPFPEL